jgi:hypothetical protein
VDTLELRGLGSHLLVISPGQGTSADSGMVQGGVPWSLVVGDRASPAALRMKGPACGLYRLHIPASTGRVTPVT